MSGNQSTKAGQNESVVLLDEVKTPHATRRTTPTPLSQPLSRVSLTPGPLIHHLQVVIKLVELLCLYPSQRKLHVVLVKVILQRKRLLPQRNQRKINWDPEKVAQVQAVLRQFTRMCHDGVAVGSWLTKVISQKRKALMMRLMVLFSNMLHRLCGLRSRVDRTITPMLLVTLCITHTAYTILDSFARQKLLTRTAAISDGG